MSNDQVKTVLDRVLTWPPERQQDAARILTEMEEQDANPSHLMVMSSIVPDTIRP